MNAKTNLCSRKSGILGVMLSIFMFISTGASAQDNELEIGNKFHMSIALGQSNWDTGIKSFAVVTQLDEKDSASGIFVGYRLNEVLSLGAGYQNLGSMNTTIEAPSSGAPYRFPGFNFSFDQIEGKANIEAKGWTVGGVGSFPISDNFNLNGKIGMLIWDGTASITGTYQITGMSPPLIPGKAELKDDGSDLYFGLGATYNPSENIEVGLEYVRFEAFDFDIDALNVILSVKF